MAGGDLLSLRRLMASATWEAVRLCRLRSSERISYEAEVRFLTINEEVGTHQSTYLVGGKFPYRRRWLTAYGKVLVGDGRFHFPYGSPTVATLCWLLVVLI